MYQVFFPETFPDPTALIAWPIAGFVIFFIGWFLLHGPYIQSDDRVGIRLRKILTRTWFSLHLVGAALGFYMNGILGICGGIGICAYIPLMVAMVIGLLLACEAQARFG